jgi:hypothetical protein
MAAHQFDNILILGAGELGEAVIRGFAAHPSHPKLTVLLRPVSPKTPTRDKLEATLHTLNVTILHGDLSAPVEILTDLFKPFDTVVSCSGFVGGRGTQLRLCSAALRAGVAHYVPWQFGVDYEVIGRGSAQDLFDEQLDVRDLLRGQGQTKWTIISTGMFTSFLFEEWFGVVGLDREQRTAVVTALGGWTNKVTVTSAEDIGRCTPHIVLNREGGHGEGGVVHIAGDTVTFAELADLLVEKGWQVTRKVITVEELEQKRREDPEDNVLKYQMIWARNKGVSWDWASAWNARNGIETERLTTWIDRNLP